MYSVASQYTEIMEVLQALPGLALQVGVEWALAPRAWRVPALDIRQGPCLAL